MSNEKKVAIISLESINNVGDEILGTTMRYLVADYCKEITTVELKPSNKELNWNDRRIRKAVFHLLNSAETLFRDTWLEHRIINWEYLVRLNKYFSDAFIDVDAIIFAVGMLKYKTQNFSYIFDIIIKNAEKRNIPIYMSAMSIAKPDREDWRYNRLKKALQSNSIKCITTRDGEAGVELLKKYYINRNNIKIDFVGDPALYIPECYGIKKQNRCGGIIGINLINPNIFIKYGGSITADKLTGLYIDLISDLLSKKQQFKLFSNGIEDDYNLGKTIIHELNIPDDYLEKRPENAVEYLNCISKYSIVFGARLHACISSVALGIPVVGIIWDDKIKYFAETMHISEFFIPEESLNKEIIQDRLENIELQRIDKDTINSLKQKTLFYIQSFLTC